MAETQLEKQAFSIAEASQAAGIGRTKLYDAICSGDLEARKYGRRTLILRSELQRFLASLPSVRTAVMR